MSSTRNLISATEILKQLDLVTFDTNSIHPFENLISDCVLISVANTQVLLTVANLRISCFFVIGQGDGIWFGVRWEFRATQARQEFSSRSRNHGGNCNPRVNFVNTVGC